MKRNIAANPSASTDRVYASVAGVAAALTLFSAQFSLPIVGCILIALLPWALLAARRRLPIFLFATLAVIPVIPVVAWMGIGSALFLTTAAASWVASRSSRWMLVAPVAAVVIALPFLPIAVGFEWDKGAVYFKFGNVFGILLGVLLRRSFELTGRLSVADAELAEAAARQERHRIARDVHDLVAHSLTVVILHVGGARRLLRTNPPAAESALAEAERVCRESLDGIRGVVGLLRDDGEPHALSLDFHELVDTYRGAELTIDLRVSGNPESLPIAERVTLYRVVQEGLANAARHAPGPTIVQVEDVFDGANVVARVTNSDAGKPPSRATVSIDGSARGGYGLVGLREQVATFGGDLLSSRDGSTWVLECRLPTPPGNASGVLPNVSTLPAGGAL